MNGPRSDHYFALSVHARLFEGLIAETMVEDNFNLVQALGVDVDAIIDDAVNIGVDVQTVD